MVYDESSRVCMQRGSGGGYKGDYGALRHRPIRYDVSLSCPSPDELLRIGTIDFDEFLKMMALKPFVLMLPTEARDYLIMTSR